MAGIVVEDGRSTADVYGFEIGSGAGRVVTVSLVVGPEIYVSE